MSLHRWWQLRASDADMHWLAVITHWHAVAQDYVPLTRQLTKLRSSSRVLAARLDETGRPQIDGAAGGWLRGERADDSSLVMNNGDVLALGEESLSVHADGVNPRSVAAAWHAVYDPFTGVANEAMLNTFIKQEARRGALWMLALDPEASDGPVATLAALAGAVGQVASKGELVGVLARHVVVVAPESSERFEAFRRRFVTSARSGAEVRARRGIVLPVSQGISGLSDVLEQVKGESRGAWQLLDW